jgi:hypothetical protein
VAASQLKGGLLLVRIRGDGAVRDGVHDEAIQEIGLIEDDKADAAVDVPEPIVKATRGAGVGHGNARDVYE